MEKPSLARVASGDKVPFILSPEDEEPIIQVPAVINQYLRDYQRDGIRFLYEHYRNDCGAILADDMGLGKTVQVIALIAALLGKTGKTKDAEKFRLGFIQKMEDSLNGANKDADSHRKHRPFLIIGPASVLYNWLDEFETWGYFKIGKFHKQYKQQTLVDIRNKKLEIIITTFETCRDNIDELIAVEWNAVFADEVHRIKGASSEMTLALKKLPCRRRYGLTGTPLQNRLDELWCIMDWANSSCFGKFKSFRRKYVVAIEQGQKLDVTKRQRAEARKAQQDLMKAYGRFLLRRTKDLIADQLPRKDELVIYCRPTDLQVDIYQAILDENDMKYVLSQKEKCFCGSGKANVQCHFKYSPDGVPVRSLTMTFMHLLLKAANHVALLMPGMTSSGKQQKYADDVCRRVFKSRSHLTELGCTAAFRTLSDPKYCGKMKVLQDLLSVCKKKRSKVLLFSYSTKLLDVLEAYVMSMGYEYRRLDGSTPSNTRLVLVQEFNKQPNIFIFLISTRAGGIGLSLTGANVVVIYDPNWNPAHDLQAQDRAYRLGQRRDVQVFRLISSGTIEENIYLRQVYKQQIGSVALEKRTARRLFRGKVSDRKKTNELSGVQNLFQLRTGNDCLTESILLRNDRIEAELKGFQIGNYVSGGGKQKDNETDGHCSEVDSDKERNSFDGYLSDDMSSGTNDDVDDISSRGSSDGSKEDELDSSNSLQESAIDGILAGTEKELRRSGRSLEKLAPPSFQSISDVLVGDDIVHMHRNKKLVRGGRVEDHITNCALIDVYELHQNSQLPAADCNPLASSSEDSESEDDLPKKIQKFSVLKQPKRKISSARSDPGSRIIGKSHVLIGHTPVALRRRQFDSLTSFLGMKTRRQMAEFVVRNSSEERRKLLRSFYTSDHPQLESLFEELENNVAAVSQEKKLSVSTRRRPREKLDEAKEQKHSTSSCLQQASKEEAGKGLVSKPNDFTCLKNFKKCEIDSRDKTSSATTPKSPTTKEAQGETNGNVLELFLRDSKSSHRVYSSRRLLHSEDVADVSSDKLIDDFLNFETPAVMPSKNERKRHFQNRNKVGIRRNSSEQLEPQRTVLDEFF